LEEQKMLKIIKKNMGVANIDKPIWSVGGSARSKVVNYKTDQGLRMNKRSVGRPRSPKPLSLPEWVDHRANHRMCPLRVPANKRFMAMSVASSRTPDEIQNMNLDSSDTSKRVQNLWMKDKVLNQSFIFGLGDQDYVNSVHM
jgi:hypothetical protein